MISGPKNLKKQIERSTLFISLSLSFKATTLLTMDKYSMQDVPNINNTCFKLNSLQLNALLSNYHCAPDEPYIPPVSQQLSLCSSISQMSPDGAYLKN